MFNHSQSWCIVSLWTTELCCCPNIKHISEPHCCTNYDLIHCWKYSTTRAVAPHVWVMFDQQMDQLLKEIIEPTSTFKALERGLESPVFIVLVLPCSSIHHQVSRIIWFRGTWSFTPVHLKFEFYFCFIWEWPTLQTNKKNTKQKYASQTFCSFKLWNFIIIIIFLFKKLYLDVWDFQRNLCLHLTFLKRVTAIRYDVIHDVGQWETFHSVIFHLLTM